jgi:hypothetical protein
MLQRFIVWLDKVLGFKARRDSLDEAILTLLNQHISLTSLDIVGILDIGYPDVYSALARLVKTEDVAFYWDEYRAPERDYARRKYYFRKHR